MESYCVGLQVGLDHCETVLEDAHQADEHAWRRLTGVLSAKGDVDWRAHCRALEAVTGLAIGSCHAQGESFAQCQLLHGVDSFSREANSNRQ